MVAKLPESRATLADHVAKLREIEALISRYENASPLDHVVEARSKLDTARGALETAQNQATAHHIAKMTGSTDAGDVPDLDGAHRAVQVATDELNAATAARSTIQRELQDANGAIDLRRSLTRTAAQAVVRDEIGPVINSLGAEVDRLQRELFDKAMLLAFMRRHAAPGVADETVQRADGRFGMPMLDWDLTHQQPASAPTLATWKAFADALMTDPTAGAPKP